MGDYLAAETHNFFNFEEREAYLRNELGAPIPRRHQGPSVFWDDLKLAARNSSARRRDYALIPPNPLDGLAFDRVNLVLRAIPERRKSASEIDIVIERFNLQNLMHRFVYSLSGGEVLRLAMAKCALQWPIVTRLAIAAPWHGLSHGNFKFLDELISGYDQRGKRVELLNLEGDDNFEPGTETQTSKHDPVTFSLKVSSLKIPLADPDRGTAFPVAQVEDFEDSDLASPCAIMGENGNGKSLLARSLAGTIDYTGTLKVGEDSTKPVRLIFQDVSSQMLLGTASLNWELSQNKVAKYLNDRLLDNVRTLLPNYSLGQDTLLQTKVAMVALRLSNQPSALVLDEPDWGLSRLESIALFHAVVDVCHFQKTPLIVITHRRWLDNFFNSRLTVRKIDNPNSQKNLGFTIQIVRALNG